MPVALAMTEFIGVFVQPSLTRRELCSLAVRGLKTTAKFKYRYAIHFLQSR
jgi:hypothetical protein